jgi:hypothetical protein
MWIQSIHELVHDGEMPVKKGRHRRFEEARAMKRSHDVDLDQLLDSLHTEGGDDTADDDIEDDEDLWGPTVR